MKAGAKSLQAPVPPAASTHIIQKLNVCSVCVYRLSFGVKTDTFPDRK